MRRIPWLLVVMAGALAVISGSALACGRTHGREPTGQQLAPTIGGTAREGQTLTASSGAWTGATPIAYAYQWQRCNSSGTQLRRRSARRRARTTSPRRATSAGRSASR